VEWLAWKTRTYNLVRKLAADDSIAHRLAEEGLEIKTAGVGTENFERAKTNLMQALEFVLSSIENDTYGELRAISNANSPSISNRVFVVHGHDSGLKTDIERFLREIGLEPIVLHRQPDEGNTLIEKFEKHSDVGYAFILLTPDEIAYTVDQQDIDDATRNKEFRARQNVIFEFGYFVGRLGRNRVCCLHKGDTVIPSDISGLVYKQVDQSIDSQAYSIIRELKAAGYAVTV